MGYAVLIVDDSPVMRKFIRRVIDASGFAVERYVEAGDGLEALAALARERVDTVLTDINMPRMNGEQLLRSLEGDERLRSIPVVVVSTDSTDLRIVRMRELGAKGYVAKPFLPETLRDELERVLGVAGV
jgi:two-component system chemotaxis response regulator CheY